ncbi:MAG: hypothetical protein OHK0046_22730 [Anaerolineae bacterium]
MHADFLTFLQSHAGERGSAQAAAFYTGADHTHYDVAVPTLRAFVKAWADDHKTLTYAEWESLLTHLYNGTSVEEKLLGGLMLAQYGKYRAQLPFDVFESWLGQLEGWQEVDGTCQSIFTAKEMAARWPEWESFLRRLARDANIHKRRASLVLLIKPLRGNDPRFLTLMLDQVTVLQSERDKLITKAISWVLREAVRQHGPTVQQYIEAHQATLPASVVREVTRKLETGKK